MSLMRITRRSPSILSDSFMDELPDRIRRMLEGNLPLDPVQTVGWMPAMEIVEKPDALLATAELPGLGPDDVNVNVEDGVLTISGEKTEEKKEGEAESQVYLWERRYGSFRRSFTLPTSVDVDKITAHFENGVLTLRLPKTESVKAKGRKIAIDAKK